MNNGDVNGKSTRRDVSGGPEAELQAANEALRAEAAERELAEGRLRLLAEAGSLLATSLDYQERLRRIAGLVVPELADFCTVDGLVDGEPTGSAACHSDPELAAVLDEMTARHPRRWDVARLKTGEPLVVPEVTDEALAAIARNEEEAAMLRSLGFRSAMSVPLVARGQLVGVISLAMAGSGRRYGDRDVAAVRDLAGRMAAAIDNAWLYEEAQAAIAARDRAFADEQRAREAAEALAGDLRMRVDQQAAIAALGQRALSGEAIPELLDAAATSVAGTLRVPLVAVLEMLPGGEALGVRASVGLPAELAAALRVPAGEASHAGYTLLSGEPTVVDDLTAELRFASQTLLLELGALSGVSVPIQGEGRQFGVLDAYGTRRGRFGREDVHFVQAMANVVGLAIAHAQAHDDLRSSEQRFKALFDLLPVGLSIADGERRVLDANPALARIVGLSREQLYSGDYARQYIRPDGTPVSASEFPTTRALREGKPAEDEFGVVKENGKTVWLHVEAGPFPKPGQGVVVATVDVTERVEAEQDRARLLGELEAERTRLEAVLRQMPDGVIMAEAPSGRVVLVNEQVERLLKQPFPAARSVEEYDVYRAVHPDGTPLRPEEWPLARVIRLGETVDGEEIEIVLGDSTRAMIRCSASPIRDASGAIVAGVVTFLDITAQKEADREREAALAEVASANAQLEVQAYEMRVQAEQLRQQAEELELTNDNLMDTTEKLEAERQRYHELFELAPDGYLVTDLHGKIEEASWAAAQLLGVEARFLVGKPLAVYVDAAIRPAFRVNVERLGRMGAEHTRLELQLAPQSGRSVPVSAEVALAHDEAGKAVGLRWLLHDVSEHKRLENELRRARDELEERVQERTRDLAEANDILRFQAELLSNVDDAVIATDARRRITTWNRVAEEMYGWTAAEAISRPLGEVIPETFGAGRGVWEAGRFQGEVVHRRRDGSRLVVEVRWLELTDDEGHETGLVGINRDVTERAAAQEALRESEMRYRQMFERNWAIKWLVNPETGQILDANPAACQYYGYSLEELRRMRVHDINVQPAEQTTTDMRSAATQGRTYFIFKHRLASGQVRDVEVYSSPITANGRTVLYSIIHDITDRVEAYQMLEQRVAERTHELATLLEIARRVAVTPELEPRLRLILDQLEEVVPFDEATVWAIEKNTLKPLYHHGRALRHEVAPITMTQELAGKIERLVLGGRPITIGDVRGDERLARDFREMAGSGLKAHYSGVRTWLGVPLVMEDRALGVLELYSREVGAYDERAVDLVGAFAAQAVMALENARLTRQARELAALEERQRLARDLHDAVSQTLFSANLIAEVLPKLWDRNQVAGRESLDDLHQLTSGALAEMRTLLLELRPSSLLELALDDLMPQLANVVTGRARIPVKLELDEPPDLPEDVHLNLYRIAQEALSNVAKHSSASCATITLRTLGADGEGGPSGVELRISDDGRGFNPDNVAANSLGLDIMRERAAEIGAALTIHSQPGEGAAVTAVWLRP